jgi:hypothetical protein
MSYQFIIQFFLRKWHEREIAGLTELEREEYNTVG